MCLEQRFHSVLDLSILIKIPLELKNLEIDVVLETSSL